MKDFNAGGVKESARPWTFTALLQNEQTGEVTFYVRTSGNPIAMARDARETMKKLDSSLTVFDVKTITSQGLRL